ncbi:FAS-associated death domain protein [Stigmatopora nigra]
MGPSHFRALLLDISRELTTEQLDNLKYLCMDKIGRRMLEMIDSGFKLFQCLTERGELGQDKREILSELLKNIKRIDLSEKLMSFQSQPLECAGNHPCDAKRAKLDIATDIIAENVGRNWRKLGRELGIRPVKLESISMSHPNNLEETARELLKEWREHHGSEVRPEELIYALRACHQNLTADKVEDAWIILQK